MTQFSLKSLLSRVELQREKTKDYRNIVIIQVIIVSVGLVLSEQLLIDSKSNESKLIISIFSFFGAIYAFLQWDLLINFTSNRIIIKTIFIALIGIMIMGILVEFPYYQIIQVPDRQVYLLTLHGILFPIEVTVISFAIRDLFTGSHMTPDKLWGAACVFLMIGISFGSLYDLITIAKPGSLGVDIELGLPNYAECISYSFSILGGVGSELHPTRLIRNISVLEAVWGSLYGMLIIGKLLGLPRSEEGK
jgi:fluoride ion exporter CrcB/FEX